MLTSEQITKRQAYMKSLGRYDPDFCRDCLEALETAQILGARLSSAVACCRFRRNPDYDTCEDNCTMAYRFQEQCSNHLALMKFEALP